MPFGPVALNLAGFAAMTHGHSEFYVCKGRWPLAVATLGGRRTGEEGLDSSRGETARRQRGSHHTLDVRLLAAAVAS